MARILTYSGARMLRFLPPINASLVGGGSCTKSFAICVKLFVTFRDSVGKNPIDLPQFIARLDCSSTVANHSSCVLVLSPALGSSIKLCPVQGGYNELFIILRFFTQDI